jgi:hypothetical protein
MAGREADLPLARRFQARNTVRKWPSDGQSGQMGMPAAIATP